MVDQMSTEDQQIAALKKWWEDNGSSLLIGIGVALTIVFGWKGYQNSVEQAKAEASSLYQQLVASATSVNVNEVEAEEGSVPYLAQQLKDKFNDSEYAIYASLFLAKDAVSNKELAKAESELNWALAATEDSRLKHTITGRLARVLAGQNKTDEALGLLVATDDTYKAPFLEIKGDIKKRQGDDESAISAYSEAYKLVKDNPQALPMLAVKLSDLGVNPETL